MDYHRHRKFGGCQFVRGYTVHLLFHLLAVIVGCACGLAAGLWWYGGNPAGLWLFLSALAVGAVVLVLQTLYITVSEPAPDAVPCVPQQQLRDDALYTRTRPDLPIVPELSSPPRVVGGARTTANAAIGQRWRSYPSAERS